MQITFTQLGGFAVARVDGQVTLRSATFLRDALLKAVAEQPAGLLCDLSEAGFVRARLALFHVLADELDGWPVCPVVLVTADPVLQGQLSGLGITRRLGLAGDLDEAVEVIRRRPGHLRAKVSLPQELEAVARGRSFVADTLDRWGLPGSIDPARLIATELVTNALEHAAGPIQLRIVADGRGVTVAVADRGGHPVPPGLGRPGLGLTVVGTVSDRWGVWPRAAGGHLVWARLGRSAPGGARRLPRQAGPAPS